MWTPEAKAAYVACAIDTDGWISLRTTLRKDGTSRLTPNTGVTNQSKELLERIWTFCVVPPNISVNGRVGVDWRDIVTKKEVYQCYWRSPLHVVKILEFALPYIIAKKDRALWVIEFCHSRISPNDEVYRSGKPYTERDWELARLVTVANGRTNSP